MAVSSRATTPTPQRAHLKTLKDARNSHFNMTSLLSGRSIQRTLYHRVYGLTSSDWRWRPKIPNLGASPKKCESIVPDDRNRSPDQRTGIHSVRTILRPEADGGGCLWACPGAPRNHRFSRRALLRALLFRAQGRRRQDRGGDLEVRPGQEAP